MDILLVVAAILLILFSFKYLMVKKAEKSKGKEVNDSLFDSNIKELLNKEKSILYFYSPNCSACRTQAPIIDKINKDINAVGKIDLSKNMAAAKEFGIMGTPTTALMVKNKVAEIFVGIKKEEFLKSRFESL